VIPARPIERIGSAGEQSAQYFNQTGERIDDCGSTVPDGEEIWGNTAFTVTRYAR
jgi:hypothetical protein